MFGLTKLPDFEHDVTDDDFTPDDATDSASVADKINAIVGSHPELFGREAPYGASVTTPPKPASVREAEEQRALAGGRPGKYKIPDIAAGRLPVQAR